MVFEAPSWLPQLGEVPDVSIWDFMFDERFGRAPFDSSLDPYVCNETNIRITARQQKDRIELVARSLAAELGWAVNEGDSKDKVAAIFALNTIDVPTVTWAIHRLDGICSPINASYSAGEVVDLLLRSRAKAILTVSALFPVAEKAARLVGIPIRRVFILEMKDDLQRPETQITFSNLLTRGKTLPELEAIQWSAGDSARKIAFMSHSSGTSGPPKMAAVSHRNIIASVMQLSLADLKGRGGPESRKIVLGMLPSSHVYGVVAISHLSTYRGDSVIVLPRFDMHRMLESVEKHRINIFAVVPPIIVTLGKSPELLQKYDLSSIDTVLSGGAPLDEETTGRLHRQYPQWVFRNAYGLTELGACATITSRHDPWAGSAGVVIPGVIVKLIDEHGNEVTDCEIPGEVYARSPGVILGYVDDAEATKETFIEINGNRWLRTGDIALFKKSPSGDKHIFIVDRVKEVIKVKGLQVVPAELEACLLTHPGVLDCAVVGAPDERDGEVPVGFIQRSTDLSEALSNEALGRELVELVKQHKARHKWLKGGITFVDTIPRSPSGKILRRLIRAQLANNSFILSKL